MMPIVTTYHSSTIFLFVNIVIKVHYLDVIRLYITNDYNGRKHGRTIIFISL